MKNRTGLQAKSRRYVHLSLIHLGIPKWNKSTIRLKRALEYVLEYNPMLDQSIGTVYKYLATQEGSSYGVIERSLRYAISDVWANDPKICSKLFYYSAEIKPCPSVSEFFYIYVSAFQRGVIRKWVDSFDEYNSMIEAQEMDGTEILLDMLAKSVTYS